MVERNCIKCVFHLSGSCSQWDCVGTVTEQEVENMLRMLKAQEAADASKR